MNRKVSALMYSGAQNPERDLTEEEMVEIKRLASLLVNKSNLPFQGGLGFTGFSAFEYQDGLDENAWGVYGYFNGTAVVWSGITKDWIVYWDDVGICAHLHLLINDTLIAHYQQAGLFQTVP
jgi:hypothetical protein